MKTYTKHEKDPGGGGGGGVLGIYIGGVCPGTQKGGGLRFGLKS